MYDNKMKIKKRDRTSLLIYSLFILLIFGCSSIEVSQDYKPDSDFSKLKTYAWKYKDQEKTGDVRIDSPLMDERIRKATERKLQEKGFMKVTNTLPDFYIIYKYSITRKLYSRPVSTGMGFGYGYYDRYGTVGIRTGTQINDYDEGLLIVDFLKPDSDIILWRGKSTRVVETHSTPEKIIQDIDETIEKMLVQFPPEK